MRMSPFIILLGIISLITSFPHNAAAQQMTNLFFPNITTAKSATGLVYSHNTTREVPATWSYDKERDGVILSILLPQGLSPSETLVSGVVIDENSHLNLSPISLADLGNPITVVPICEDKPSSQAQPGQSGLFTQLVEIRERRIQVARKKLEESISPELFRRLQQLEKGFDLSYRAPLSLNLPAEELAERLDILFHTVQRYEFYKSRRNTEIALDSHEEPFTTTQ